VDVIKKTALITNLVLVFLIGLYLYSRQKSEGFYMNLKYVVTETRGPDSFDPNDADKTQNLSVMRMLYATPLEIDKENLLGSFILKSFHYEENLQQIRFEVRNDVNYSDGSKITVGDVALAIARTAYFRPDFPVVKNIIGVKKWSDAKKGLKTLPQGMKIKGNLLTIDLDRKLSNPLFRFCLELFSVIPKSCIDLETAAMTCEIAPSSGYFAIKSKNSDEIIFQKRKGIQKPVGEINFESVTFQFKSIQDACRFQIEPNQVIAASEIDYVAAGCTESIKPAQVHWMPSARFLVLRFNPETDLFKSKEARHYFAEVVREILRKKNSSLIVERSLFPKLLPGYLDSKGFDFPYKDMSRHFKGVKIRLPQIKSFGALIFDSIIEAAQNLEMKVEIEPEPPMAQMVDSFLTGNFPVIAGSSGFWAQDPIGDVSMWFTKNLHKPMRFIWTDTQVYKQISSLENELDPNLIKLKMEMFNRHIFDQSLIAPVLHFRRCFISNSDVKGLILPQAITSPAPWQLVVGK
jgi:hypothetical protein